MKANAIWGTTLSVRTSAQHISKGNNYRSTELKPYLALMAGIVLFPLSYAPALAGGVECTSNLGAVTISDDLEVPADGECKLSGTIVVGKVEVKKRGKLTIEDGAIIEGDVKADKAAELIIIDSTVMGKVTVKKTDSVVISGSSIDDDLKVDKSGDADIRDTVVNGNVDVKKNTGDVILIDNTIDGDWKASGNVNPIIAEGNEVNGDAKDQAASAELPCPCTEDLPSGWASDLSSGLAAATTCPDESEVVVSEGFSNFVGFAGSPFVGTALQGGLGRDCDGFISANCRFTPDGPDRDISELQFEFCRSTFSAP